ncbi:MAG: amine oxidase, partial [Cyanobacteria bacterium J06628_3]
EAANLVVDYLGTGVNANILPVEPDEPHIQTARTVNSTVREIGKSIIPDFWLP